MLSVTNHMESVLARRQVVRVADSPYVSPRSEQQRTVSPPFSRHASDQPKPAAQHDYRLGAQGQSACFRPQASHANPADFVAARCGRTYRRRATRLLLSSPTKIAPGGDDTGKGQLTYPPPNSLRCSSGHLKRSRPEGFQHLQGFLRFWQARSSRLFRFSGAGSPTLVRRQGRVESITTSGTIAMARSLKAWVSRARRWPSLMATADAFTGLHHIRCSTQDGLIVLGSL